MSKTQVHIRNLSISLFVIALVFLLAGQTGSGRRHAPPSLAAPLQQTSGVSWNPTNGSINIAPGEANQFFDTKITNTGTQTESVTVSAGNIPAGWDIRVTPDPYTFAIAPGLEQKFRIILTAPADATPADDFSFELTAVSSLDPGQIHRFVLAVQVLDPTPTPTVEVLEPLLELSVVGDSAKSGKPGDVVEYLVKIRNPGNVQGKFHADISQSCDLDVDGCSETLSKTFFVLNGGEEQDFQVSVILPADAPEGEIARTIVRAILDGNESVSAEVTLITTIEEAPTPTNTRTPTNTPTPGRICGDYYEIDDDPDLANFIEVNQPQPRPADDRHEDDPDDRRTICPAGDEDWIKFGAVGGKVYTIDILEMADGLDLSLEIFDEDGNSLAFNDDYYERKGRDEPDSNDIRPRIDSWRAPADGVYYIRVRDTIGRGGLDRTYQIVVVSESYGPTPVTINEVCLDKFEPDGLPEQASLITSNERQQNRSLCPTGDADWVTFFGKKGKRYFIQTNTGPYAADDRVNDMEAGADTVLTLLDRDGVSLIDFNDDIPAGNTFDSEIEFIPEADGFYFVQVKNVGDIGNQFIRYDLTLVLCLIDQTDCSRSGSSSTSTNTSSRSDHSTPTPTIPDEEFSLDATNTPTTDDAATPVSMPASSPEPPTYTPLPSVTPTPPVDDGTLANVQMEPESASDAPAESEQQTEHSTDVNAAQEARSLGFAHETFWRIWQRHDQPVVDRRVARSWVWGLTARIAREEPYRQSEGGMRQVQYFDKGRMEINDPEADPADPWFVTFGLLAQELLYHYVQVGEGEFVDRESANIVLIGDPDDPQAPTYASFRRVVDTPFPDLTGEYAMDTLDREGHVGRYDGSEHEAIQLVHFSAETQHNIPRVFWEYLNAQGEILQDGEYTVGQLVDWKLVGYPISEPYWVRVRLDGVEQDVLVQVFQRRVLTYFPQKPAGENVEMLNVGRHYYEWRYGEPLP